MSSVALPGATSSNQLGAITNQSQFNTEYTQFLGLLTTELQNQDPTSPMDTSQFTSQLVGFSQLEQQLQTNQNLQTLIADQQSGGVGAALGYLGHTVMASGNAFELNGSAPATLNYSLASTAASAMMTVTNANGQAVETVPVSGTAGLNSLPFDGSDNGFSALPAGDYTYAIQAVDANGNAVAATTYTTGAVTGIDTSTGAALLHLGDLQVPATSVVQISS